MKPSGVDAYILGRSYDTMPIAIDPGASRSVSAGALMFIVEARTLTDADLNANENTQGDGERHHDTGIYDGGASVHVIDAATELEYLRFDCFDNEPHYHYIRHATSENIVIRFDNVAEGDPLGWTLARLRSRLPEMLTYAGASELAARVRQQDLGPAIDEVGQLIAAASV